VPLVRLESEEEEEGITHHGCGAAGTPSGLRSLFLLPARFPWNLSLCGRPEPLGPLRT
jgi:hypothetical protein